jgi:hypothetical protein
VYGLDCQGDMVTKVTKENFLKGQVLCLPSGVQDETTACRSDTTELRSECVSRSDNGKVSIGDR